MSSSQTDLLRGANFLWSKYTTIFFLFSAPHATFSHRCSPASHDPHHLALLQSLALGMSRKGWLGPLFFEGHQQTFRWLPFRMWRPSSPPHLSHPCLTHLSSRKFFILIAMRTFDGDFFFSPNCFFSEHFFGDSICTKWFEAIYFLLYIYLCIIKRIDS